MLLALLRGPRACSISRCTGTSERALADTTCLVQARRGRSSPPRPHLATEPSARQPKYRYAQSEESQAGRLRRAGGRVGGNSYAFRRNLKPRIPRPQISSVAVPGSGTAPPPSPSPRVPLRRRRCRARSAPIGLLWSEFRLRVTTHRGCSPWDRPKRTRCRWYMGQRGCWLELMYRPGRRCCRRPQTRHLLDTDRPPAM